MFLTPGVNSPPVTKYSKSYSRLKLWERRQSKDLIAYNPIHFVSHSDKGLNRYD